MELTYQAFFWFDIVEEEWTDSVGKAIGIDAIFSIRFVATNLLTRESNRPLGIRT